MNPLCLEHNLSADEREQFERNGFFVVDDALPPDTVASLVPLCDELDAIGRREQNADSNARLNHYDVISKDRRLLELLDCPTTIAKVWDILGWNIQLYHSHLTVNPSIGQTPSTHGLALGWHQDSGQLNGDLETSPRPRISLKIGYFLTDTSEPGRGNLYVLPGSHLSDTFPGTSRDALPEGAVPVCVRPGAAVFFDRRIWHSGSTNFWHEPRRVLFYGYSYRWLRPRDEMNVAHYLTDCDPIRRQLLGESVTGGRGFTSPTDADVPLKAWLQTHRQLER
ncbi:MAG: phytanoyl-CoA dioxygenase family protein [Gammaproteobacteria bacterium]|nr:phytanoyl-CoA dioxygenase family protein [Gammaproteobacteria bacterium]